MTKGKAWTAEEELKLKELFEAGEPFSSIATDLGKTTVAVGLKASRLGLKDDGKRRKLLSSSSDAELMLVDELPTMEETVKIFAEAMLTMRKLGISKSERQKWKDLVDVAWKYKEFLAEVIDYKGLEKQCAEWRRKYEELAAKRTNFSAM